ncbi:hypothetical protein F5X96DRAFT_629140 [Biscogniauxia mediterranea]|nr:hypothetical protein F5X96DRAFT_629140 [Biscogniauxia mediterranea]
MEFAGSVSQGSRTNATPISVTLTSTSVRCRTALQGAQRLGWGGGRLCDGSQVVPFDSLALQRTCVRSRRARRIPSRSLPITARPMSPAQHSLAPCMHAVMYGPGLLMHTYLMEFFISFYPPSPTFPSLSLSHAGKVFFCFLFTAVADVRLRCLLLLSCFSLVTYLLGCCPPPYVCTSLRGRGRNTAHHNTAQHSTAQHTKNPRGLR